MLSKAGYLSLLLALVIACQPVPVTGRRQLHLIPQSQILELSYQSYDKFLDSSKVVAGTPESEMVKRVGAKISKSVEQFFKDRKQEDRLKGYSWEFNLIQDSMINAWCMPGGKVGVYTGILPVTQNEAGLAVVMGHEIAHAVANHGNERMSQLLVAQLGGIALQQALATKAQETQQLAMLAFGVGTQIGVLLPYSRLHESEADRLGLIFMAMAGYDPREAVPFWQRMASTDKGARPPEFLSTHPSPQSRIESIQKLMPEALKYYNRS